MADVVELLDAGAQAWSAVRDADEIEILNRNNGVPTLGSAHTRRDCVLFWHAAFEDDEASLWIYLKLGRRDKRRLRRNKVGHLLDGVTLGLRKERPAVLGVAYRGDLIAWAPWQIPAGASARQLGRDIVTAALRILAPKVEAVRQPETDRQRTVVQAYQHVHQAQTAVSV